MVNTTLAERIGCCYKQGKTNYIKSRQIARAKAREKVTA